MNLDNSLDRVVREVSESKKYNPSDEVIVIIDRKKWKAIPKKPWHWFGGDLVFYLVSNSNNPANIAERNARPYQLTNFSTGQKLGISITYWASCDPGNEEKVAESLCRGKTVAEALDRKVEKWIADFTRNDASVFLENYSLQLARLQEHIKIKIKEEVGLNLELKLSLEKESRLESFPIPEPPLNSFELDVYVTDCDEPLKLDIKTELIVDEPNKVKAIFNDISSAQKSLEIVRLFKKEIKHYLLHHVSLDQFSYELKDTVRDWIVSHLNSVFSRYGRKVGYLSLSSDGIASTKQLVEIKRSIECEVRKYSNPILIENTLLLFPRNTGRYKQNQNFKLENWVVSKLEKIIKPLLLQKKYVEILMNFEPLAQEIKKKIQDEAQLIGYEVQQIVSIPNLEHQELKEDFEVIVPQKDFDTSNPEVKVSLGASVSAKIKSFTKIEDYLKPQADIKKLIEEVMDGAICQLLRKIEPERYYMRFNHPGMDENGQLFENKSVEQELIAAIEQVLERRFDTRINQINIHVYETDIAKHFKKLQGHIGNFECKISSNVDLEEPVLYKGKFIIEGVDDNAWYTFESKKPEINDISSAIVTQLEEELSNYSKEQQQSVQLNSLKSEVNEWIKEYLIDLFGLKVKITNLLRPRTQLHTILSENKKQDVLAKLESAKQNRNKRIEIGKIKTNSEIKKLNILHNENLNNIEDLDEEDIKDEIADLEKEAISPSIEELGTQIIKPQTLKITQRLHEIDQKPQLQSGQSHIKLEPTKDEDEEKES